MSVLADSCLSTKKGRMGQVENMRALGGSADYQPNNKTGQPELVELSWLTKEYDI
jgi:hypothetical protein